MSEPPASAPRPAPSDARSPLSLALFVALGAFLLFALEPMVGRVLLPRFGGAFYVWTTALMFFQAVLVLAYGYAHLVAPRIGSAHFVVLALALLALPVGHAPAAQLLPDAAEASSIGALLLALTRVALLPFFALASTSVVAQDWLARSPRGARANAYVLYAVSNAGSLVALFAYALLVEPMIGLRAQGIAFSVGYAIYLVAGAIAFRRTRAPRGTQGEPAEPRARPEARPRSAPRSPAGAWLDWILLAAWPSALLMAVTNVITLDAGNAPLLWIVPLAVYLLTFILAFSDRGTTPSWVLKLWPHFAVVGVFFFAGGSAGSTLVTVVIHLGVLFVVGWAAHGTLYAARPEARGLTGFYLLVALGGWLGGAFVALLAPAAFSALYEYPLALAGLGLTIAVRERSTIRERLTRIGKGPIVLTLALLAAIAWKLADGLSDRGTGQRVVQSARSAYGLYHVVERATPLGTVRDLVSGETRHGRQVIDGPLRREPLGYYHREGPLGDVFAVLRSEEAPAGVLGGRAIGAIGLGVGAIAAYLEPGDTLDLYEIDPLDVTLARERFRYLEDARGTVRIHVGDARLSLEREARSGLSRRFDLLFVDAFAGDAIPTHLLTREAVEGELAQLTPRGLILVHVSNRFYDLAPWLGSVADALGLVLYEKERRAADVARVRGIAVEDPSVYVALIRADDEPSLGARLTERGFRRRAPRPAGERPLFTDDWSPSLRALRLGSR